MTEFLEIFLGLAPSFGLILLGGIISRRLPASVWQGIDKLNFEILFPALIFSAAASRPIAFSELLSIGPAVWAIMICGLVIGWSSRRFGPDNFLDFAGSWQTAWRFNTAIAFVAISVSDRADVGIMAITIGLAVPLANILAVSALSRGGNLSLKATVWKVLSNPFLIASLAGVIVGLSRVDVPPLMMAPVNMLAKAAIPIALLSIGATMNRSALAKIDAFSAILNATKLIISPALVLIMAWVFGLGGPVVATLVIFAALPTASAAHVLASAFGAGRERVATIIAQSTLLSAISLPLWMSLL